MKTLIAVPCMDQVATPFCQSLLSLNRVGGECSVSFQVGSLVSESREKLAALAISSDADYVLWLDSDMIFSPDTMERLMKHMETYDIVTGLYFRRRSPFSPVIFKRLHLEGEVCLFEDYTEYPSDRVFEVEGMGFGCVMMKTEVLLSVFARYKNCFTMMGRNGEDVSFSMRARNCGYKIMCDPTIKCGHISYATINESFYQNYKLHQGREA